MCKLHIARFITNVILYFRGESMPTSDAQKRATMKYMKENLEEVRFRVPKGKKNELKQFATDRGESLQSWIIRLLEQDSGISIK